jgi:hypothetical protein
MPASPGAAVSVREAAACTQWPASDAHGWIRGAAGATSAKPRREPFPPPAPQSPVAFLTPVPPIQPPIQPPIPTPASPSISPRP